MKLSSFSKLSHDLLSTADTQQAIASVCFPLPVSPVVSRPCVKAAERQAGQEIQNILSHKGSRPQVLPCAAPLPIRSPPIAAAADPEEYSDEDEELFDTSDACFPASAAAAQRSWFAGSPTVCDHTSPSFPLSPRDAADCSAADQFPSSPLGVPFPNRPSRPILAAAQDDTPTTIVGTPPCRAGNPMVNDTHFMTSNESKIDVPVRNSSAMGCELGLFRLSPAAF
jgi:hypothetical protein